MRVEFRATGISVLVLLLTAPLLAHHRLGMEAYELNETVPLEGVVTGVQWVNPHVRIDIEARGPDGRIGTWTVELGAATAMEREGVDLTLFEPGVEVRVDAWVLRDGTRFAAAQTLRLPVGPTDESPAWSRSTFTPVVFVRETMPVLNLD